MKSIVIIALTFLGCIGLNEALQCYSHEMCSTNCKPLAETIKTCNSDENKCYKGTLASGVTRGCAKEQCTIQIDGGASVSSICCEKELCNSAVSSKLTLSTFFMIIGVFIMARM
ncbi:hypothetical protein I4U23_018914 [Adineta vaga]|nr:hypothetical protein I4U23_018914 [Adineta vaga]